MNLTPGTSFAHLSGSICLAHTDNLASQGARSKPAPIIEFIVPGNPGSLPAILSRDTHDYPFTTKLTRPVGQKVLLPAPTFHAIPDASRVTNRAPQLQVTEANYIDVRPPMADLRSSDSPAMCTAKVITPPAQCHVPGTVATVGNLNPFSHSIFLIPSGKPSRDNSTEAR